MEKFHQWVGILYEVLTCASLALAMAETIYPNNEKLKTLAAKVAALVLDFKKLLGVEDD